MHGQSLQVNLLASGDVADWVTPGRRARLLEALADGAGLTGASGAALTVRPGSLSPGRTPTVHLEATFPLDSDSAAAAAAATLQSTLGSASAATAFFAGVGITDLVAQAAPSVAAVFVPLAVPPSAPSASNGAPGSSGGNTKAEKGGSGWKQAVGMGLALVGAGLLVAIGVLERRGSGRGDASCGVDEERPSMRTADDGAADSSPLDDAPLPSPPSSPAGVAMLARARAAKEASKSTVIVDSSRTAPDGIETHGRL